MSKSDAKAAARVSAKANRAQAHATYEGFGGGLFIQPFIRSIHPAPGQVVAAYAAIGDEADPVDLLRILSQHGCVTALPCVIAPDAPLTFRAWAPDAPLTAGAFGTREPEGGDLVVPDFVIVPLLAFSPEGHRLGYGGGYYDRTLQGLRAQKPDMLAIGLAFAAQEVTHLPVDSTDQPLDWIVTERGAHAFQDK